MNNKAEITKALVKFHQEVSSPKKTAKNPHFKSRYADLEEVLNAVRQPLTNNGLVLVQSPGTLEDGAVHLETVLLHESGEHLGCNFMMPVGKNVTPQAVGSAITYARRYSIQAMLGLAAEDDDGESAMNRQPPNKAEHKSPNAPVPSATAARAAKAVTRVLSEADVAELGEMPHGAPRVVPLGNYKGKTVDQLPPEYISKAMIIERFASVYEQGDLDKETFEQLQWMNLAATRELGL